METSSLWQMLTQAGWTMVPLYLCSMLVLALMIRKGAQFQRDRVGSGALLDRIAGLGPEELGAVLEADATPLGRVLAVAARDAGAGKRTAEESATRAALVELDHYESWVALVGFIAQIAPLFGLLGTVIGMVDLFSSMELAGNEVSTTTLSAGIWKALLTTAAGLMVAIPALGGHLWLTRRLDRLARQIEVGVGRILAGAEE